MTRDELDALIVRRDEVAMQHETAVALLEREGLDRAHVNRAKCVKLYDELAAIQRRIDEHLASERKR